MLSVATPLNGVSKVTGKPWRASKEQRRCLHPSRGFSPQKDGNAICCWRWQRWGLCSVVGGVIYVFIFSFLHYAGWPLKSYFPSPWIPMASSSLKRGEWWERSSFPVYKQRKALPGQVLFHLLVSPINICNCFSRQKCKENVFPTAEDMKGRMQNVKKCLELLHCFKHKSSLYLYR